MPACSEHGVSGWRLEPSESAHPSPQRINYRVYSRVTHSFQLASSSSSASNGGKQSIVTS